MGFYATFVGINRHDDNNISDLSGAVRDATSIWALFKDSVPDFHSIKLTNQQATKTSIISAAKKTFEKAKNRDTTLFYFAGHGTPNHQLVPYDCDVSEVDNTTILMNDLVELLSKSKAKSNIIILDCCFSGGATARVLENVPKNRNFDSALNQLKGKGRVIIAAANENQSAYEFNGQGVLTKELVNLFIKSDEQLSIGVLTDKLLKRVGAITAKYGWDQTPVIFSLIEGNFIFPLLKPGAEYLLEFPDTTGIQISSEIKNLEKFQIHKLLIEEWNKKFQSGLNSLQLSAVNKHRILEGKSLFVVAPTSSGKTFIGELASAKSISEGKKAIFLLPFKALANEKYEDFKELYQDKLNIRVIRCTGDFSDETSDFLKGKFGIALLTYEMFLSLSISNPSIFNKIGLIVIDEAQFITDETRGINVELLLTNIISEREKGNNPQILLLSAVIGDVNHFHEWLDCELLYTQERPVPLEEGVLDRNGIYQYLTIEGHEEVEQIVPSKEIIQRGRKPSSQDLLIPLIKKLVKVGEQVIIFRNSRGATKGCANYLANELGLKPAKKAIAELPTDDLSSTSDSLIRALKGGTAFHNSDLNKNERLTVEKFFRNEDGEISVLVATTTVAAGINTPATTVIIVENFFYGETRKDFTVAEYKNMAGRAGRLGISQQGKSILIADSELNRKQLFNKYTKGQPEAISSTFDTEEISTWVIRLLSQIQLSINRKEVVQILSNTYGGYLRNLNNPEWSSNIVKDIDASIDAMVENNLLKIDKEKISLTLLGRECGKSGLSFNSILKLIQLLRKSPEISALQLIALLQVIPEVGGYTPLFKKGQKESAWQKSVAKIYGRDIVLLLQNNIDDIWDYYGSCKRAAILNDWIRGEDIRSIEYKFTINSYSGNINAGDIRRFADSTRLFLRSAFGIVNLLLLGEGPDEKKIDELLIRLEYGIPVEAIGILDLPISLTRGEVLDIYRAGVFSKEEFIELEEDEKKNYLSVSNYQDLMDI